MSHQTSKLSEIMDELRQVQSAKTDLSKARTKVRKAQAKLDRVRKEPLLACAALSGCGERNPDHHHPKFLDPTERSHCSGRRMRRQ